VKKGTLASPAMARARSVLPVRRAARARPWGSFAAEAGELGRVLQESTIPESSGVDAGDIVEGDPAVLLVSSFALSAKPSRRARILLAIWRITKKAMPENEEGRQRLVERSIQSEVVELGRAVRSGRLLGRRCERRIGTMLVRNTLLSLSGVMSLAMADALDIALVDLGEEVRIGQRILARGAPPPTSWTTSTSPG